MQDLNAIVLAPSIYDVDRFSEVEGRQKTQDLLDASPQGEDPALGFELNSQLKRRKGG